MANSRPRWYVDPISPFAYLQWQRFGELGLREAFALTPILFAAVLKHHGQLGPAEIPGKRDFTYRHVQWLAAQRGVTLRFPPRHPFNPLPVLRLCIAAGSTVAAVDRVFRAVWVDGIAPDDPAALADAARDLGIDDVATAIAQPAVKAQLAANTEAALAEGVFGVPTIVDRGERFWGDDATAMWLAFRDDPQLFMRAPYDALAALETGVERRR